MRFSQFFAPTLRQEPADAELISHKLLLRAGYIRRVSSGVYNLLPAGLRVLRRIESIVRDEMDAAGAQELLMPMVQPAELWQASGRWDKYGPELLRFHDRKQHQSCLGPTHEEVICDLVKQELRSYRQMPLTMYQIQSKFRDEIRPRFGLMRGREFTMKDAYSFHADDEDLHRQYQVMYDAYKRIFTRLGLHFRAVEADNGSIGGQSSHEFHVLADSGEDLIVHCQLCQYAANVEKARAKRTNPAPLEQHKAIIDTPQCSSIEALSASLGIEPAHCLKTLVYRVTGGEFDQQCIAVCLHGDDQLQELKLCKAIAADELQLASDEDIIAIGSISGFVGPQELNCPVILDLSLKNSASFYVGANQPDKHLSGFCLDELDTARWADIRQARANDGCPCCQQGQLQLSRGIEVGHIFELGKAYTESMDVGFLNKAGKRDIATMGCYGIGVSRLMAAIVEQCHDDKGICWPDHLAPFHIAIIALGKQASVNDYCQQLHEQLQQAGYTVLWDDRKERPGVKFCDAELMGIPIHLVVGDRGLKEGQVECQRRAKDKVSVQLEQILPHIKSLLED